MKKLNLRIPALLLVVILIMAFAIPAFAANSSDASTAAVEAAGGLSDTAAKALGAAIAIGLAAAGGAIAMGVDGCVWPVRCAVLSGSFGTGRRSESHEGRH